MPGARVIVGVVGISLVGGVACQRPKPDPPPPVTSATLPVAPPNATGAFAAGRGGPPRSAGFDSEVPSDPFADPGDPLAPPHPDVPEDPPDGLDDPWVPEPGQPPHPMPPHSGGPGPSL